MSDALTGQGHHGFQEAVWPDVLAFAFGLGLAWWQQWDTTDLVWSLWLSSLLVGFALIVWMLSEPLRELLAGMRGDRSPGAFFPKLATIALFSAGTLLGVAFFAVHFGGFHFVHSVFLSSFFPVLPGRPGDTWADFSVYAEVVRRYWWFVPVAALAERQAFRRSTPNPDTKVTAQAIRARKAKGDVMMTPYRNVVRMHLLIFFFAAAHFLRMENFLVYAVVYAVYFFPWRVLRRASPG